MNNTLREWLKVHYPAIYAEWEQFFKEQRKVNARKWAKEHYLPAKKPIA